MLFKGLLFMVRYRIAWGLGNCFQLLEIRNVKEKLQTSNRSYKPQTKNHELETSNYELKTTN